MPGRAGGVATGRNGRGTVRGRRSRCILAQESREMGCASVAGIVHGALPEGSGESMTEYAEFLAAERWKSEGGCFRPESVSACPIPEDWTCTECPYWRWNSDFD